MSTNKDIMTGLCSGTLVLTYRFTSNRQPADWKGPMDGSISTEQRISLRYGINHTGGKLNAKENSK